MFNLTTRFVCLIFLLVCNGSASAQSSQSELTNALLPYAKMLTGAKTDCELSAEITFPVSNVDQQVTARFNRLGKDSFELEVAHEDYAVEIRRNADATAMILPRHNVVFYGQGSVDDVDSLAPQHFVNRVCTSGTRISNYVPLLNPKQPVALVNLALTLLPLTFDTQSKCYQFGEKASLELLPDDAGMQLSLKNASITIRCRSAVPLHQIDAFGEMRVVPMDRGQLEKQLARGTRRALELLVPSSSLLKPEQKPRRVPHGELRWVDGQRVVLLEGSPEEIGTAHGQLLKEEASRCMDSVMNVFGTIQTIRTGRWFRDDLHDAAARLLPHIPDRHRRETRALAASLELDPEFVEELNVFPELFHCSGFAVFGSATKDGKLYHGRVLDYMTMIGLQDSAVTFIMAPDGQFPFANIGYAAFIGSVSGMNTKAISLGEMGGKGEGLWDGVPMATLMRRALEECDTLDEVIDLWKNSPRTCEYYYVFADGKTRRAVGVAARPESIEFIQAGEAHPLLGPGIPDAVVLSAGSRLEALRARVQEKHGQIDADLGQWLMCRPVAMKSNLHNVLFVPEDGVFYVANADHAKPAAELPYARLNLVELVNSMKSE